MIITETPLRISFLGGGTDYPEYFLEHGGAVLGTAIDKHAYLSVSRFYSRLFDYSIRVAYRQVECVRDLDQIQHAPVRECLRHCGVTTDVEVSYTAELPSFSGLGTSSTFVVGLLQALHAFQGRSVRGIDLAHEAVHIERDVLDEAVGCQDQTFAAIGGVNVIEFRSLRDFVVHRVPLSQERVQEIESHLFLVYTGLQRRAHDVAQRQIDRVGLNRPLLHRLRELVDVGYRELTGRGCLERFGRLLHESWQLKSELDSGVSNDHIRSMYEAGMEAGAFGGKLLGAGAGGFLLFVVPPERRAAIRERLGSFQELDIHINAPGSRVIHA